MEIHVFDTPTALKHFEEIIYLTRSIWPRNDASLTIEKEIESLKKNSNDEFERHILAFHSGKIIGYSRVFSRRIEIDGKIVNNMALACVCVQHNYQKQGIGHKIVKKAFHFVNCGKFECSLFQTGVPHFYSKLGAITISNKVINSLGDQKAFWDPFVMLYPKHFKIGNGYIDIKGNGY